MVSTPPGQHPPFATITHNDHSAWIIISTALGLWLTLLFAAMRIFIRFTVSPGWGWDDYLQALATVRRSTTHRLLDDCTDDEPQPGNDDSAIKHSLERVRDRLGQISQPVTA